MATAVPLPIRLRKELIAAITKRIARLNLNREQAAELLVVDKARVSELQAGRAERFRLDRPVALAERAGQNERMRATRPYGAS